MINTLICFSWKSLKWTRTRFKVRSHCSRRRRRNSWFQQTWRICHKTRYIMGYIRFRTTSPRPPPNTLKKTSRDMIGYGCYNKYKNNVLKPFRTVVWFWRSVTKGYGLLTLQGRSGVKISQIPLSGSTKYSN